MADAIHTVGKGDTLSSIAKRYNTTVADLAKANNIRDVNKIGVNQKINIPSAAPTPAPRINRPTPAPTNISAPANQQFRSADYGSLQKSAPKPDTTAVDKAKFRAADSASMKGVPNPAKLTGGTLNRWITNKAAQGKDVPGSGLKSDPNLQHNIQVLKAPDLKKPFNAPMSQSPNNLQTALDRKALQTATDITARKMALQQATTTKANQMSNTQELQKKAQQNVPGIRIVGSPGYAASIRKEDLDVKIKGLISEAIKARGYDRMFKLAGIDRKKSQEKFDSIKKDFDKTTQDYSDIVNKDKKDK